MSRRAQIVALGVAAALVALGIVARAVTARVAPTDHAVVVFDRSDSKRGGCDAVVGVADSLLASGRWRQGSTLVVLATGSEETLGEPVEAYRHAGFHRARTVEGRSASVKAREALLRDLRRSCEGLRTAGVSPICAGPNCSKVGSALRIAARSRC
jgi:hypothetical protein